MAAPHIMLDLTAARRLLVAGDIHGHLDRLKAALAAAEYDPAAGDRLILLGDLLDRGPDVLAIYDWLEANPSVIHILGNHDEMLIASLGLSEMNQWNNPVNLLKNGGQWLLNFAPSAKGDVGTLMAALIGSDAAPADVPNIVDPRIIRFAERLAKSPVAITVTTPWGRKVALVHADVPRETWTETISALESPNEAEAIATRIACTWERRLFNRMEHARRFGPEALAQLDIAIPDVDHVFLGHSIVSEPTTAANLTWLDTGPYKGNGIAVLDVDSWLDRIEVNG